MTEKPTKGFSLKTLIVVFAGGNLGSMALRMIGGLLTARFVDPGVLGLFNGMGLVLGYAPFFLLGVQNALNRELPFYIGRNERERASELASSAKAWTILVGGLAAAVLSVMAVWQAIQGHWDLALGWVTYAFGVWVLLFGQFYMQITYRTSSDFAKLSVISLMQNACSLVLVSLVAMFGFTGLCFRSIVAGAVTLWLTWKWLPLRVKAYWDKKNMGHLFKVGAPIFMVGQIYAWWSVLDCTLVLKYAGTQGLGLYQLSIIVGQAIAIIPSAAGQILYPRMAQEYGRSGCVANLAREAKKPVLYMLAGVIPCLVAAWYLLPPVASWLLPKYVAGTEAAQWTMIAVSLLVLAPFNNIFNVVKRQDLYVTTIVAGIVTYVGVLWGLTRNGVNLVAFPQAMLAGRAVFLSCSLLLIAYLLLHEKRLKTKIREDRNY